MHDVYSEGPMEPEKRAKAPDLGPEEGWELLAGLHTGGRRGFIDDDPDGDRVRVRWYVRMSDGRLVGKAWFGPGCEGPPGHAHGGSIAAVMDQAMGAASWMSGNIGLAAEIVVRFRQMLPLGTVCAFEARVASVQGKKIRVTAELRGAGDGRLHSEAEGLFIRVDPSRLVPSGE